MIENKKMDITFREILNEKGDSRVLQHFTGESFVPRVGDFVWLKGDDKFTHSYRVMSVSIEYVMRRHAYVMVVRNKPEYKDEE